MINIRPYQESDFESLKTLLEAAHFYAPPWESEENLAGMIKRNPNAILVAVDSESGDIVGNVFTIPYGPKVAILFRLTVKTELRKQGLATRLIAQAEKNAVASGAKELGLFVDADKEDLFEFYKKRGFINSSKMPSFYRWKDL